MNTITIKAFLLGGILLTLCAAIPAAGAEQLDYVIIGNSIGTMWAPNYAKLLSADLKVNVKQHNYYVSNQHAADLLEKIRTNSRMRQDIQSARIVTIGIGFADISDMILLYGPEGFGPKGEDQAQIEIQMDAFKRAFDAILSEIDTLKTDSHPVIRTMNCYCPNVVSYQKLGVYKKVKDYWMAFNECIGQVAEKHKVPVADIFQAMNGIAGNDDPAEKMLIASDKRHPSSKGLQLIAEEVRKLGYD